MSTRLGGYMGKVMLLDLTTKKAEEYPWTDEQRELYTLVEQELTLENEALEAEVALPVAVFNPPLLRKGEARKMVFVRVVFPHLVGAVIEFAERTANDRGTACFCGQVEPFEHRVGWVPIIRIDESIIFTGCNINAFITSRSQPLVNLMYYLNPFIYFLILIADLRTRIFRPVINQNNLQIGICLISYTFYTFL